MAAALGVVVAGTDGVRLWRNDGQRRFSETTESALPAAPLFGIKVAAGDVDEDGALDLVVATTGQTHAWLNDGTGRFRDVTPSWLPVDTRRTFGVALVDVDGDLDLDLVLATPGGPTRLLRNAVTRPRLRLAVAPSYVEVGTAVILAVAAVDEDGLAAATLTLTDPSGGTQSVDLLADLADGHAVHGFTPALAGTYTANGDSARLPGRGGHAPGRPPGAGG